MLMLLPQAVVILFVFLYGLVVGSFLNVLIARLPFEKSVLWPGSRCFSCLQPIALLDNLPIIGYLRLRGKCRRCGATFSSRYLWVELFTGLAFVGLYVAEVLYNVHESPGIRRANFGGMPGLPALGLFFVHAFLLAMLIAASVIDLKYKIIPPQITVGGTFVGLLFSTIFPWPWPCGVNDIPALPVFIPNWGGLQIPIGMTLWPVWQPPAWAPAGSVQLGFLTGLAGAAAGQFIGRSVKYLFEHGFGKEALGIGDADLLMMAGAFLGWQPIALAFFVGAIVLLPIVLLQRVIEAILKIEPSADRAIPFGPGIAAGIVICWLNWTFFGELVRTVFFDGTLLAIMLGLMGGGLLISGFVITLVRGGAVEEEKA